MAGGHRVLLARKIEAPATVRSGGGPTLYERIDMQTVHPRNRPGVSPADRKALARRYGVHGPGTGPAWCFYCGAGGLIDWRPPYTRKSWWPGQPTRRMRAHVYFDDLHIEHRISLHRGGRNDITNLVLSCSPCNLAKGWKHNWPSSLFVEAT